MSVTSQVRTEANALFKLSQKYSGHGLNFGQEAALPEPVKRYFRFASPEKCSKVHFISTKFEGLFCLKKTGRWVPITGDDYYAVNSPGFVWSAKIKIHPLFWLAIKDSYLQSKGKVLAKAYSLFTVASAEGPGIDQGALSRWLGSAVLFPEALLPSANLSWEYIDESSAKLRLFYEGIKIDAVVYFGKRGEIVRLVTDRFCSETHSFEKWSAYYKTYADYNGRKIPTEVGAIWHFHDANFNYARFRFTAIDFDKKP